MCARRLGCGTKEKRLSVSTDRNGKSGIPRPKVIRLPGGKFLLGWSIPYGGPEGTVQYKEIAL